MKKRETWCFEGQNTPENPIISSQGRLHHSKVDIKRESKGEEAGSPDKYFLPCPSKLQSSTETFSFVARTEVSEEGKHDRSAIIGYGGASQTQDCTLPP